MSATLAVVRESELDDLYKRAIDAGAEKVVTNWRYRLSKQRARQVVAESQLQRLCAREAAGLPVTSEAIHEVEQELGDAAGAVAFCREIIDSMKGLK